MSEYVVTIFRILADIDTDHLVRAHNRLRQLSSCPITVRGTENHRICAKRDGVYLNGERVRVYDNGLDVS